jgi:hypothetical protein
MYKSGLVTINRSLAQVTLVVLINTLGLTELVSDALGSRKQKEAETNAKIVDLLKHALDETKKFRNDQQRVEFHIALVCVMPARETQVLLVQGMLASVRVRTWIPVKWSRSLGDTVSVLSRPFGQKTSSQSHHQQGFGIVRKG